MPNPIAAFTLHAMRHLFSLLVALLLLHTLPAAALAHEGELEKVRLQLKWKHQFQFAGYYAALEKGFYADEGLDVELVEGGPEISPMRALLSGDVEYAVGNSSVLLDRSEGKPVVVLASMFQHSAQVIYTRPDISDPAELKGKRIVMMQDGRREVEAFLLLKKFGIGRDDFIRQPGGVMDDLASGKTDAWPGYSSNEAYLFAKQNVPFRMLNPRDFGMDIYGDLLLTTEHQVDDHQDQVEAFHRATIHGWEYALDHVDEMIALIQAKYNSQQKSTDFLRFESNVVKELMATDIVPIGLSNKRRWQYLADLYTEIGYPIGEVDWDRFIYKPQPTVLHVLIHHLYPYRYWMIMGALIVVVLVLFLFILQLRSGIRRRTVELEALSVEYRDILDHMQDTYYRADSDGRLLWVSASVERQLGYSRKSLIGSLLQQIYYDKDGRERFLQALESNGGKLSHYEICLKHKDGSRYWAEINSHYWYDKEGKIAGVEGNMRGINERKLADQKRDELTGQLQQAQKMESIGVLAGGIAHDFNNLLVGVMGNAELALLDTHEEGELRYNLEQIFKASRKGADLVRQMLAFSGQGRFEMGERNLNQLISEISELLSTVIGKKVEMKLQLNENLPPVIGDKNQLTQMLMNLMTNAGEAMEGKPGTIILQTGTVFLKENDFSRMYLKDDLQEGEYVFVEVQDNGCGMDGETQQRIFDPFFTTKETGSGLGLAALLGIVRSHGGALSLYSEPGMGSCFKIYFPAVKRPFVQSEEEQEGDETLPISLHGAVLLIDDEAPVRDVASRILGREGLKVIVADDGEAGLAMFKKHADEIALVLLDLTMPKLDGEQTFNMIHALRPDIPVLLSSGFSETDAVLRLQQRGLAGFVRKPYSRNALLRAIAEAEINIKAP